MMFVMSAQCKVTACLHSAWDFHCKMSGLDNNVCESVEIPTNVPFVICLISGLVSVFISSIFALKAAQALVRCFQVYLYF